MPLVSVAGGNVEERTGDERTSKDPLCEHTVSGDHAQSSEAPHGWLLARAGGARIDGTRKAATPLRPENPTRVGWPS